jgi:hypothetical protein
MLRNVTFGTGARGHIHEALATLRPRKSIVGPIHPIVHWLPNKRFAWPQICDGFGNMARPQTALLHPLQGRNQTFLAGMDPTPRVDPEIVWFGGRSMC